MLEKKYNNRFPEMISDILSHGDEVSPRGMLTQEICSYNTTFDPYYSILHSFKREINLPFLFAENLWYWSGRNTYNLPTRYIKNYKNFSDQGILQGAYGVQIAEQIRHVINILQKDKDSRQAVISLWRPNPSGSKDTPCTLNFHFMIRDGKLDMHVVMRSNDLMWGNNFDIPSFSLLQIATAGILQMKAGNLHFTANSLHIYEKHFELASEIELSTPLKLDIPLLDYKVDSLEQHIDYLDEMLYLEKRISKGTFIRNDEVERLPDFWKQYYYIFSYKFFPNDRAYWIKKLKEIKSPLGTILYERLEFHKSKQ